MSEKINFGQASGISLNSLKGGLKRESLKSDEMKSIFDKVDTDNNGILDDNEVRNFTQNIDSRKQNDFLDKNEAKDFIKNFGLTTTDSKGKTSNMKNEFVMQFLHEIQANTDQIASTREFTQDGVSFVEIKNNDGSVETINTNDKTSTVTKKDENGNTIEESFSADRKLTYTKTTDSNGNVEETQISENGTPVRKTITQAGGTSVTTIEYDESGNPKTKEVKRGTVTSNYEYDSEGNERITSKVENQGNDALEKTTTYEYSDNGNVIENITQQGKQITRTTNGDNLLSEVVVEGDKTTTTTYNETGKTEVIVQGDKTTTTVFTDKGKTVNVTEGDNSTETAYNNEGFKLSEKVTINGQTYSAKFDGKGHGRLTMKAGETIESFAQRVGCKPSEIRRLNHFPGGIPQAGQSIVVPERCVHPADANNQVSASSERARGNAAEQNRLNGQMNQFSKVRTWPGNPGRYHSYEEVAMEALQKEVKEGTIDASLLKDKNFIRDFANKIKQMNNNANVSTLGKINVPVTERMDSNMSVRQDGREHTRIQQRQQQEMRAGGSLADSMYEAINNHKWGLDENNFKNSLAKINSNNIIGVLDSYKSAKGNTAGKSLISDIFDETSNTLEKRKNAAGKIITALKQRAAKALGSSNDPRLKGEIAAIQKEIDSFWSMGIGSCDTLKLDAAIDRLVAAIKAIETTTSREANSVNSSDAIDIGRGISTQSQSALDAQLKADGWSADLYEGMKWLYNKSGYSNIFGKTEQLDEIVQAKINRFNSKMNAVANASKKGGEAAFNAEFERQFGVPYNKKIAAAYRKQQEKYAMAISTQQTLDVFKNTMGNINSANYSTLCSTYSQFLIDAGIAKSKQDVMSMLHQEMMKQGIDPNKATDAQKTTFMRKFLSGVQKDLQANVNKYTGGKSLPQMKKDLISTGGALFGASNDISTTVADYVDSQQKGGAVVKSVVKIAGTAAVMALTGGAGGVLVGAASVAAGTTIANATVEISDNAYSVIVNGGEPLSYDQIEDIMTNALQDGLVTGLTFGIGKYAKSLTSLNKLGQAGVEITGKTVVGSGKDLVTKGQISIEGVVFNVIYSSAGKLVSLKPVLSKTGMSDQAATIINTTTTNTVKSELKDSIGVNTSGTVDIDIED